MASALDLFDDVLGAKLAHSRRELLHEYRQPHAHPWVIGYSGGKDSTVVVHLVLEMLLELPRSERTRQVHIVANDTRGALIRRATSTPGTS